MRPDEPRTPPRTPLQASYVEGYKQYWVQPNQMATPLALVHRTYRFDICVGLPGDPCQALKVNLNDRDSWISCGEGFLRDRAGEPVARFRVIIDSMGTLILTQEGRGSSSTAFHHQIVLNGASPVAGEVEYSVVQGNSRAVLFAGEIGFGSDGKIYYISNRSGHYKPDSACFEVLLDLLSLYPERLADLMVKHTVGESESFETMDRETIQGRRPREEQQKFLTQGVSQLVTIVKGRKRSFPDGQSSLSLFSVFAGSNEWDESPKVRRLSFE